MQRDFHHGLLASWGRTACVCLIFMFMGWRLATVAHGQVLPSEPIQLAEGHVILGGLVAGTISAPDDDGFFNYTDYRHNALQVLRLALSGVISASDRFAVLGEVQTENFDTLRPYALYARMRPWADRSFDIQTGRIPPTFGAYGRRGYGIGDPLIGYPLAYQYLTTLRSDSLPSSTDDLLELRGKGYRVRHSIGSAAYDSGLPLISALRWDTGVQFQVGSRPVAVSGAVTQGTLSKPRVDDDNSGKQFAGRLRVQPSVGLIFGLSAASGPWVSDNARDALPAPSARTLRQTAVGFDLEYSRGFGVVRGEAMFSV